MAARIRFFATRSDFDSVFGPLEEKLGVKYVKAGPSVDGVPVSYDSYTQLPKLGFARTESTISGDSYLILKSDAKILPSQFVPGKYMFMENERSVMFRTGGRWKENILLYGEFVQSMDAEESKSLFKTIRSAAKKGFTIVRGNYVGPEALALLRQGFRLTIAEQSPSTFDLTEEV